MKKSLCPLFIAMVFCFFPILAVAADSIKVGVVDIQRCLVESEEGKRIVADLKKKKDEMQKKLDERQNKLVDLKNELDKQSLMLSMDAKEDKAKEFERERREFKYFYDDLVGQMRKAEGEARSRMIREVDKVVKEIGQKENFTIILERRTSGVMYNQNSVDITDKVIKNYNMVK